MKTVNVSFDIETSRLKDLEAFLNGGKASGRKPAAADDEPDFAADDDAEPDFLGDDAEPDESEAVTADTIRDAVAARVKAGKSANIGKLFTKYKAKNVSTLKKNQYDAFYTDLMKIKVK